MDTGTLTSPLPCRALEWDLKASLGIIHPRPPRPGSILNYLLLFQSHQAPQDPRTCSVYYVFLNCVWSLYPLWCLWLLLLVADDVFLSLCTGWNGERHPIFNSIAEYGSSSVFERTVKCVVFGSQFPSCLGQFPLNTSLFWKIKTTLTLKVKGTRLNEEKYTSSRLFRGHCIRAQLIKAHYGLWGSWKSWHSKDSFSKGGNCISR